MKLMAIFVCGGILLGNPGLSVATDIDTAAETKARNEFTGNNTAYAIPLFSNQPGFKSLPNDLVVAQYGVPYKQVVINALVALIRAMANLFIPAQQCSIQFTDRNLLSETQLAQDLTTRLISFGGHSTFQEFVQIISDIYNEVNLITEAVRSATAPYTPCTLLTQADVVADGQVIKAALITTLAFYQGLPD